MWQPSNRQWWILVVVALFVVAAWPPANDRSLALKFINWAVDPGNVLPVDPGPIPFGLGDDPDEVDRHDGAYQAYTELYRRGGWIRTRLLLKVASDPLNSSTERQLLTGLGVLTALALWRLEGRRAS